MVTRWRWLGCIWHTHAIFQVGVSRYVSVNGHTYYSACLICATEIIDGYHMATSWFPYGSHMAHVRIYKHTYQCNLGMHRLHHSKCLARCWLQYASIHFSITFWSASPFTEYLKSYCNSSMLSMWLYHSPSLLHTLYVSLAINHGCNDS
jgi:hypothetical protein